MSEVGTIEPPAPADVTSPPRQSVRDLVASTGIDTRLAGMIAALLVIWISFHALSDGKFITARNLWNLSVQSTSIGIMATGMVLIIVTRNIDLSVGSLLGLLGYTMALLQTDGVLSVFGINVSLGVTGHHWYTWILALIIGGLLGALIGVIQGYIVAYVGVPAFIVTLSGFLAWRGLIFRTGGKQGQTLAPLDQTFRYLGGAPELGGFWRIVHRVAPLGWHIVLHFDAKDLPGHAELLDAMPCPYVIDHMARVDATAIIPASTNHGLMDASSG